MQTDNEIDKELMVACNKYSNLKKFVKSYKKMKKKGLVNLDMDTMLRGLLHPSDYRQILHQVFIEPKVTIGKRVVAEEEEEVTPAPSPTPSPSPSPARKGKPISVNK